MVQYLDKGLKILHIMDYNVYKVYKTIINKLTFPGLTLILLIISICVYYAGILEYSSIHLLIRLTFISPTLLICTLIIGTVIIEGIYTHTSFPFIICRRRLDVPNAPWESFEAFILDYDEQENSEFFDFQNDIFSNDGFCPRSFAEMDTPYEVVLGERIKSTAQIDEFFRFVIPRMGRHFEKLYVQSLTFPTFRDEEGLRYVYGKKEHLWFRLKFWYGGSLIDRAPKEPHDFVEKMFDNFERPDYVESIYNIDPYNDFKELGISLVSGSAEDSSSYIYEVEQPQFFPHDAIQRATDAYDPDQHKLTIKRKQSNYFGIQNMGTFLANMTTPEKYSFNNNYELLEEYPVNVDTFYIKREWEENVDALTFRDPLTGNYSNLTRFTTASLYVDISKLRNEFFLIHKAPRTNKQQITTLVKDIDVAFAHRNVAMPLSKYMDIPRFLTSEFTRFGWVSYLQSLIEHGLRYLVALDKDRSRRMYSGFPGELELLPTGIVFNYMNKLFNPKKRLFSKLLLSLYTIFNKYLLETKYKFFFFLKSISPYRISFKKPIYNVKLRKWNIIETIDNQNVETGLQPSILV